MMRAYAPIKEEEEEGTVPLNNQEDNEAASYSGCGCFRLFSCFDSSRRNTGKQSSSSSRSISIVQETSSWFVTKFKDLKEASEVVAGPKWKNFIRKMSKYFNANKSKCQFQYDPVSYALNFDGGGDDNDDEEDNGVMLGFSSRFAPPVSSSDLPKKTGL